MTSPLVASLTAAHSVTNVNVELIKSRYLAWCQAQPDPNLAATALQAVAHSSKYPETVLINADAAYAQLDAAGVSGEDSGSGSDLPFADLTLATAGQTLLYDDMVAAFKPADLPVGGLTPSLAPTVTAMKQLFNHSETTSWSIDLDDVPAEGSTIVMFMGVKNGWSAGEGGPLIGLPTTFAGCGASWTTPETAGGLSQVAMRVYVGEACNGIDKTLTGNVPLRTESAFQIFVLDGGTVIDSVIGTALGTPGDLVLSPAGSVDSCTALAVFETVGGVTPGNLHNGDSPGLWTLQPAINEGSLSLAGAYREDCGATPAHGVAVPGGGSVGIGLALQAV